LVERVVNIWNCLPPSVNYSTLATFMGCIEVIDANSFLKCDTDYRLFACIRPIGQQYCKRHVPWYFARYLCGLFTCSYCTFYEQIQWSDGYVQLSFPNAIEFEAYRHKLTPIYC